MKSAYVVLISSIFNYFVYCQVMNEHFEINILFVSSLGSEICL